MKQVRRTLFVAALALGALHARQEAPESSSSRADEEALGSTRGSVVALEMSEPRELVYLTSGISSEERDELERIAPNLRFISDLNRQSALEHAGEAHAVDAHLLSTELIERAPQLRWAQSMSAGVERYIAIEGVVETETLVLTNMKGMHGPAIAEHAFAMLLSLTRNLRHFADAQEEGRWDRRGGTASMTALSGRTMLVVGLGGIGREIARRAKGFDMRVIATARTRREPPEYVERLGVAADLDAMLPEADVVAVCVPLTEETEGLFDAERFARMKSGSWLVNIARGRVVDTDALLEALDSGRVAGACLDVTDPEPLPRDHPLWKRRNVVITPHVAARAEITGERRWRLFRENARRFAQGEPLLNVVDKAAGY